MPVIWAGITDLWVFSSHQTGIHWINFAVGHQQNRIRFPFYIVSWKVGFDLKRVFSLVFHQPGAQIIGSALGGGQLSGWCPRHKEYKYYIPANHLQLSWGHRSLNPLYYLEKLLILICTLINILILVSNFLSGIASRRVIWAFSGVSWEHLIWTKLFIWEVP